MKPWAGKLRWTAGAMLGTVMALCAPAQAQTRGELLYSTHCIACHTAQMHWREKRLASDWNSLKALVRRWQGTAMLNWNEDDVLDVTRFLNDSIYRFAPPTQPLS